MARPLLWVGLGFIVSYSVLVLVPTLTGWVQGVLLLLLGLSWVLFVLDYVLRLVLTPRRERWAFVRANLLDLLSAFIPLFRSFKVVTLLLSAPIFHRRDGDVVRTRVMLSAACYAIMFVYFIALATLQHERYAPGASITTFGDALWWACVTIATVGYGDVYPVTGLGRVYAVTLMAGGIVIVGTASAVVISYLNERMLGSRDEGANDAD